mmetsp:Transcript_12443/g.31899  ORF Transcript_12443/g.31899 Transcript_12443/m.31899 type:complete len:717 (-) Transcript_12443:252-2402(-)
MAPGEVGAPEQQQREGVGSPLVARHASDIGPAGAGGRPPAVRAETNNWGEWSRVNRSINKKLQSGAKSVAKAITRDARSALLCVAPGPDSPPVSPKPGLEQHVALSSNSASEPAIAPHLSAAASRRSGTSDEASPSFTTATTSAAIPLSQCVTRDNEVQGATPEDANGCWTEKEVVELAHAMSIQLDIRDRTYLLSTYRNCFIGEEAVKWLIAAKHAKDEKQALVLGNRILDLGLIEHVTRDHAFKNDHLFYHFTPHCFARSAAVSAGKDEIVAASLSQAVEITQLRRALADISSELDMQKCTIAAVLEAADQNRRVTDVIQSRLWYMDMYLALLGTLLVMVCLSMGGLWGMLGTAVAAWVGGVALRDMRTVQPRLRRIQVMHSAEASQPRAGAANGHGTDNSDVWEISPQQKQPSPMKTTLNMRPLRASPAAAVDAADDATVPTPEEFQACPDHPLLLRLKPELAYQHLTDGGNPRCVPINRTGHFEFETRLFKGRAMLWVTGLQTSPPGLFKGRQRKTSLVVQGFFKEALPFDDVFTGQEFERPIRDLPASWLVNVLLRIARKLSPSSIFGLLNRPHILTPVVAGAQCINICKASSSETPDLNAPPREDMLATLPSLKERHTGEPLPSPQRKKWFTSAKNRAGLRFDTEHLYTFHFWQHLLDLSAYELDMGVAQFDISRNLNRQPLQLMVKQQSTGEYLWNFEVWHENLLRQDD